MRELVNEFVEIHNGYYYTDDTDIRQLSSSGKVKMELKFNK